MKPLPSPQDVPTLPIPEAGTYLGLGRAASYRAAAEGYLPTIRLSEKRYAVPTAALRRLLALDTEDGAA
jgi:hypothetical protein